MFSVPLIRCAIRHALDGIRTGVVREDEEYAHSCEEIVLLLVPRTLSSEDWSPRKSLEAKVALFESGQWDILVEMSLELSEKVSIARGRRAKTRPGHRGGTGQKSIAHGPVGRIVSW